ncbi:alpha/beta fold hydrolase [Spirosoma sp. KUDC1026]|uniref:alpha/beta fold hydrolase n=1 Tax=Spirosoma sp. KUDC1026 TaxID=2745947 RepID=UPI00159B895A|nr:alpha/beta hydrolase [Spirosoma sp. KUDC1026]QKZ14428.1 alpha/beta hydrolase [Spirosoma sp. KUDC1026]
MTEPLTLVLIHGHGVDASIWNGIDADLVSVMPVLKPDFSRLTTRTTIEGYAEELMNYLRTVQAHRVVLVGHSMGGYMALAFAERYPALVAGLVLYHSTATADTAERKEQRQKTIGELREQGSAPFIEKQMPKMVAASYPAEKIEPLIDQYRALPANALAVGMTAIMGRPDRTHILREATVPMRLVLGKEDQVIPCEKTQQLADLSEQIDLALIDQAGHLSMVEQPEASVNALRSFLDRL